MQELTIALHKVRVGFQHQLPPHLARVVRLCSPWLQLWQSQTRVEVLEEYKLSTQEQLVATQSHDASTCVASPD